MMFNLGQLLAATPASAPGRDAKPVAPANMLVEDGDFNLEFISLQRRDPASLPEKEGETESESGAEPAQPSTEPGIFSSTPSMMAGLAMITLATKSAPQDHGVHKEALTIADEIAAPAIGTKSAAPAAEPALPTRLLQQPEIAPFDQDSTQAQVGVPAETKATVGFDFPGREPESVTKTPLVELASQEAISTDATPTLRVTALETHLPAALAQHVAEMSLASASDDSRIVAGLDAPAMRHGPSPVKILRFELEPAALGALTIRMRMTQSRIEIEIESQSAETLSRLNEMRDRITEAISATGCAVDALDLCAPVSAPLEMSQPQANDGRAANPQTHQEQGQEFSDGPGSRSHKQPSSRSREAPPSPPDGGDRNLRGDSGGVYL